MVERRHRCGVLDPRLQDALTGPDAVAMLVALADKVEAHMQGGLSARPLLSVPHILADESSCYYHGYVLAEMSVHQTRSHFLAKYGHIVDNPNVGKVRAAGRRATQVAAAGGTRAGAGGMDGDPKQPCSFCA